jgi:hypothetical protein
MTASLTGARRQRVRRPFILEEASDEVLLATRLCDLPVQLEGTLMARRVGRLHRELTAHNIVALPHVWLSEEFFNPDGVLGFALPFYLSHPRLMRLERSQMLEVEGAGEGECRRGAGRCRPARFSGRELPQGVWVETLRPSDDGQTSGLGG